MGVHFGTHLGGGGGLNRSEVDSESYQELQSLERALGWLSALIFARLRTHFGSLLGVNSALLSGGRRRMHVTLFFHRFSTYSATSSLQ